MAGGIVIGVSTTVVPRDKEGRSRSPFFERMARRMQEHGAEMVLFHPERADFAREQVKGYTLGAGAPGKTRWEYGWVAMPDAIYENVFVHLVMQGMVRPLRRYAAARNIPLFNPLVPGKAVMTKWVAEHMGDVMRAPHTKTASDAKTLLSMMDQHGRVYVKPTGGHGGYGVMRMHRSGSVVHIDSDRGDRGRFRRTMDKDELQGFVRSVILRRHHIVQEQIPLLRHDGGSVDFRVVVQRDIRGEWKLVGIVPKVSSPGGVVTNLVAGGKRYTVDSLAEQMRGSGQSIPVEALERAALVFSRWLSKKYPTLGVIGYDLGVGTDGKVWFIEMNPKPARSLLYPEMQRKAGEMAVDFAYYLASR